MNYLYFPQNIAPPKTKFSTFAVIKLFSIQGVTLHNPAVYDPKVP
jgi:hypothetical protein